METKITVIASYGSRNGTANIGGTSSRTFAEAGDTSSLGPHPTSDLGVCLFCAPGAPVADILAHSPPFPIVIDHFHIDRGDFITGDVEGIIPALGHCDRVLTIRFRTPAHMMEKILVPIDDGFPMLEHGADARYEDSVSQDISSTTTTPPHIG